jgi:threonine/homoserine/homoserine lactone efflux protein
VVVRNTLAYGKRGGLAAAAGAAAGNTTQAAIAGVGVALLFARWPAAATVLRLSGGAYLLWLGIQSLRRTRTAPAPPAPARGRGRGTAASFRQGLIVNLLNPAITSFYVAVVPSFVPPHAPAGFYALLAAAHIVIAFACHIGWTLAFDVLRRHAERPAVRRSLDALAGIVLIGLAAHVLLAAGTAVPD